jgi:lipoprotein NlpI
MRHLLIGTVLLLAGCTANTSELRVQMDACNSAVSPDAAMTACSRVLEHKALPQDARSHIHWLRARAAMTKQDMASAVADLDESIRLDDTQAVSFATRGIARGTMGDMASAITDFTRAIELGNDEAATRNGRCWARAVLGQELDLARQGCEAAVRMEPEDGNNHNSLGFVHFRNGDTASAIAAYTTSLSLDPKGASSYYMRGRAKALANDATAQADIDQGLGLEPGVADRYAGYGIEMPPASAP